LGGYYLWPINAIANIAFQVEILDLLRTWEERELAVRNRAKFVQEYVDRNPSEQRLDLFPKPKGEDSVHYEFFPGVTRDENLSESLFVTASDDVSTSYNENHTGGTSTSGGVSSSGDEDLGGLVPAEATKLWLEFTPRHPPCSPWIERIEVDLISDQLSEVWWHSRLRSDQLLGPTSTI
jgi:hypothetical protein